MSRIGSNPVAVPADVKVSVAGNNILVEGKLGKLSIPIQKHITVKIEDSNVIFERDDDSNEAKAMHGLTRSLVSNAVLGVTAGYKKELLIVGVGYKALLAGNKLTLNLGYSHQIEFMVPDGIKITVTDSVKLLVEGFDKQLVGEVAARIRRFKKPEPYKGKGVRFADEHVVIKPGKTNA